ncbi:hypothetical protein RRG08_062699 [Elysia crispata]|uniref:Uncharacterized protein n=1 Tax=Elysia crispata TaxID=231223 RepID=A0AAE1ABN6_9GAST|nr:hypothetical protein RRG08_062699 [Elysia crispata]
MVQISSESSNEVKVSAWKTCSAQPGLPNQPESAPEIISCFTGQIHNILTWCPDSVASRLTGKLRGFESLSIIRLKLNSYKFCHPNEYVVSLIYVINSAIRINMWSG